MVDLPVKPGWIPSWDEGFYDPSEFADPAGELLAREFGDDPVVQQLIAEVAATPVDPDAVAGRMGGFSSWAQGLPERSDRDLVTGLAEAEHAGRVAAARQANSGEGVGLPRDLGAEPLERLDESWVAAVDVEGVAHRRLALGTQRRDHQAGPRTDVGRPHGCRR